jgi:hypothetical protein
MLRVPRRARSVVKEWCEWGLTATLRPFRGGFIAFAAWLAASIGLGLVAVPAQAMITFFGNGTGNNNEALSASVSFDLAISGITTQLVVTLTNTGAYQPNDPADILTAVFFTLPGDPTLSRVSAVLDSSSVLFLQGAAAIESSGNVVGGEWAYATDLTHAPHGASQGISATGFNLFGPPDVFPGPMLGGLEGKPPDGVSWGLTTSMDDASAYNGGLTRRGFIKDSIVVTLGDVPAGLDLSGISDVSFQYGTSLRKPNIIGVIPEPSTLALLSGGLLAVFILRRRHRARRI